MKEITLQEILDMPPEQLVEFLTGLDMKERMEFYSSLLDRHKDFLAERIDSYMGGEKFSDVARAAGISEESTIEELEPLAKDGNPAAQYYLSRKYLARWQKAHPYQPLASDYENVEPTFLAVQNDWENARRWAIECTEQEYNEGVYAQALCYDRVTYPDYVPEKQILLYDESYAILRYEQVVLEKHDSGMAFAAMKRLGELYPGRDFSEISRLDETRNDLRDKFLYRCRVNAQEKTEQSRLQAEFALDNLRYYDEQRITAADLMLAGHPEAETELRVYREVHERLLKESVQ